MQSGKHTVRPQGPVRSEPGQTAVRHDRLVKQGVGCWAPHDVHVSVRSVTWTATTSWFWSGPPPPPVNTPPNSLVIVPAPTLT